jgi:hypothetical protein
VAISVVAEVGFPIPVPNERPLSADEAATLFAIDPEDGVVSGDDLVSRAHATIHALTRD